MPIPLGDDSVPKGSLGVKLGSRPNPGTGRRCDLGQMASLLWRPWLLGTCLIHLFFLNHLDRTLRPGGLEEEPEHGGLTEDPSGGRCHLSGFQGRLPCWAPNAP